MRHRQDEDRTEDNHCEPRTNVHSLIPDKNSRGKRINSRAAGLETPGTRLLRISGKGGVHGVGTVVFTVSAQFCVPVIVIWALTRGITSYASEIVALPAGVEYAAQWLSLRSPRQWPFAAVESKGAPCPV